MTSGKPNSGYTPQPNSIPDSVVRFFLANPEEELDLDALEAKFDRPRRQWHSILGPAVESGLLKRTERAADSELVYSLGNNKPAVAASPSPKFDGLASGAWLGAKPAKTRKSPSPTELFDYSSLDLAAIEIKAGQPLPPARNTSKGFDWTPLLSKLNVGDHAELPIKVKVNLGQAVRTWKRAGKGEFALRTINATTLGCWRVK